MISRTTKRLFLYVCPQDAAGKYKRTRRALIPMILANVKPGTMLYTDGWRVGMFDDYSDKSYPFLSGKIDFNSIKILFFNFIVVKTIIYSRVNNRASNMPVGGHTDACLSTGSNTNG